MKKEIGGWLKRMERRHPRLRRMIRALFRWYLRFRYRAETFRVQTDPKVVLFASYEGRSYSDSPRALFEYMLRSGRFADYTLVWGFRTQVDARQRKLNRLTNQLLASGTAAAAPRVAAVKYDSPAWRRFLAQAGVWIVNYEPPEDMVPKRDQIFLETWHGTPLKRLGCDLEHLDDDLHSVKDLRRRYMKEAKRFTYFLSPSPYASSCFRSAWKMDGSGRSGMILEEGYPRNDRLFQTSPEEIRHIRARVLGRYNAEYLREEPGRKIVLYAPTYRQEEKGPDALPWKPALDPDRLQKDLGGECIFLIRAHYFLSALPDSGQYRGFLFDVSDEEEIAELFLISDILITDYSSVMFDYANLRRPMIFYMYDLEQYRDRSNGFYFDPEKELPGPIVRSQEELTGAVRDAAAAGACRNPQYAERYRCFHEKFNPLEDGGASERVVNRVFSGRGNPE